MSWPESTLAGASRERKEEKRGGAKGKKNAAGGGGCRSRGWPAVGSACTPEVRRARRAPSRKSTGPVRSGVLGKFGGGAGLGKSCLGLSLSVLGKLGVLGKFGRAG